MEDKILSLEQKMVHIRTEIPALVKRTYSEDVSYDFIKIDDIFHHLAPAMNKWKVNFDIGAEKASKKDEQGNPVFIMYLAQCQLWLYEADLDIKWTNAENPEDTSTVTIHAIGTHEMPEKAKGSAWTYALKYYLLDKYCIDQGGEDPDMRSVHPQEEGADQEYGFDEEVPDYAIEDPEYYGDAELENVQDIQSSQPAPVIGEEFQDVSQPDKKTPASRHIRPESGKMVELPETVQRTKSGQSVNNTQSVKETHSQKTENQTSEEKTTNTRQTQTPLPSELSGTMEMTVEEACDIICTVGVHRDERFGDLALQGEDGFNALRWFAYDYRGKNEQLRQGARLLLQKAQAA